jgi:hypothetical protein
MKYSKIIKMFKKHEVKLNHELGDNLIHLDSNKNSFIYDLNESSLYIHYSNDEEIFSKRLKLNDLEMILIINKVKI